MTTLEEAECVVSERQFDLPDAILTPLRDMESGDSILIRLFESNPLMEQIPLVVIASAGAEERRRALRLGLLGVVAPPYDDEEVTLTTKLAIDKHRHDQALFGTMSQLSVADLLQTAEVGRRSGTVSFQHDDEKGRVWLLDGRVIAAEIQGGIDGKEAVYEIATWETGTFEADFGSVDIDPKFSMSPSELLLEAMRRLDESRVAVKDDTREIARTQTLDTALILLNTVISYASNHMEVTLALRRLEAIRDELGRKDRTARGLPPGSGRRDQPGTGVGSPWRAGGLRRVRQHLDPPVLRADGGSARLAVHQEATRRAFLAMAESVSTDWVLSAFWNGGRMRRRRTVRPELGPANRWSGAACPRGVSCSTAR